MDEQTKQIRYLSTFTGIGGFEVGIQNAIRKANRRGQSDTQSIPRPGSGLQPAPGEGVSAPDGRPSTNTTDQPHYGALCVGYSEINQPAIKTYEEHFSHENYGDITTIDPEILPEFGLIVGGFPCQTFSIAGKRAGFDETRGTLFFEIARIISHKRPRHLVLENVKGLLSHDGGQTVETIFRVLSDLGYDVEWQLFNSKDWGVPQNRERIYIIGHLRGECGRKILPLRPTDGEAEATNSPSVRVGTLRTHKDGEGFREVQSGLAPTLPARGREDGSGQPVITVPEATKQGYAEARVGDSINVNIPNSKTRRGRVQEQSAGTLGTANTQVTLLPGERVRRLTPVEYERLQGFPDNWTLGSDSQRYKQGGNAVTTNVVERIITAMLEGCTL